MVSKNGYTGKGGKRRFICFIHKIIDLSWRIRVDHTNVVIYHRYNIMDGVLFVLNRIVCGKIKFMYNAFHGKNEE